MDPKFIAMVTYVAHAMKNEKKGSGYLGFMHLERKGCQKG